jgi:uncharacterized RDD family membrane protein YckC
VSTQGPASQDERADQGPTLGRRLLAAILDLRIILFWIAFTTVAGFALARLGAAPTSPAGWDAYAFLTLILPVGLTFAFADASPRRGTWGKRRQGLQVVSHHGQRITLARSLLRQAVKLGPWQVAHTAVFQLFAGSTSVLSWVLAITPQALVLASVTLVIVLRPPRALHDLIARTRVIVAPDPS